MQENGPTSWQKLIHSWVIALIFSFISIGLGVILCKYYISSVVTELQNTRISWFQGLGVFIVLLATLAFISWGIQTRGGKSKPEQFNTWAFRILYTLGSALLIASVAH